MGITAPDDSGLANPSGSNQAQQQSLMANAAVAVAALANTGLWPPTAPSANGPGQMPGTVVSNAGGGSGNWMLPSQPSVHSQYPPPRPMNSGTSGSSSCMMSANAQANSTGSGNLLDEHRACLIYALPYVDNAGMLRSGLPTSLLPSISAATLLLPLEAMVLLRFCCLFSEIEHAYALYCTIDQALLLVVLILINMNSPDMSPPLLMCPPACVSLR
ncbi:unnamed protein product [Dibothriocephalus latus]|uniref:Uncharacterized protein n=1 Tax=Dibothriocephalus latus TaxID=60516 RepID=A0A3P7M027_DIBLA|nr:unnamed protein product [Dibothriocephalus latus]